MEIKTKFNPGDKVWVMKNDEPTLVSISRIEIEVMSRNSYRAIYIERHEGLTLMDKAKEYHYSYNKCFATKKELLDSFLEEGESC